MNPNGSGLRQLTHTRKDFERDPAVSPNGQWVAYSLDAGPVSGCSVYYGCLLGSANPTGVYVRRIDGHGGVLPVTAPALGHLAQAFHPVWSPNGRRLAFVCVLGRGTFRHELCAEDLTGGHFKVLTHCNCVVDPGSPLSNIAWNRATNQIVFETDVGGCGLDKVPAGGGTPSRLAKVPTCDLYSHTVAPNGAAEVLETGGARAGGCCFLFAAPGGGGALRGFTSTDNYDYWSSPSFSPDGTRLAVYNDNTNSRWGSGIFTLSTTNSADVHRIARPNGFDALKVGLDWGPAPSGSPRLPQSILCGPARALLRDAVRQHRTPDIRALTRAVKYVCA